MSHEVRATFSVCTQSIVSWENPDFLIFQAFFNIEVEREEVFRRDVYLLSRYVSHRIVSEAK